MDLIATLSEPNDVASIDHLAKTHYVAEQSLRDAHHRKGHKSASPCPDFATRWEVAQREVRARYLERALELASSDQYKRQQVNDIEFANALYTKCCEELDPDEAGTTSSIQLDAFKIAVTNLLSSETGSGPHPVQVKEEEAPAAIREFPQTVDNPDNAMREVPSEDYNLGNAADGNIQALETAVKKGLKALAQMSEVFGASDDWDTEADWVTKIKRTISKARREKVVIGIVGSTGAGKSSLINALIDEKHILTTDCMRASTAVPVEVSYNKQASRYRAEIQFIELRHWERELNILFAELGDHSEELARGEMPKDSEAAVALDKIMAVYPTLKREHLLETSPSKLLEDKIVFDLLGQSMVIEENDSKSFSESLKSYIDSKGKKKSRSKILTKKGTSAQPIDLSDELKSADPGIGLWPLVRVVRVYVKAGALSTGAVLVDLPGVYDSNAARVAVAKEYMNCCSAHWIVAPINRAVSDKVAHDLLGKNFKIQMHMNSAFNDITFICTKTDDIVPMEVVQSLGLELPPVENVEASERFEALKIELQASRRSKKKIADDLDDIEEKIEELESELEEEGFNLDDVMLTPKKRKKARNAGSSPEELLATMTFSESIEDPDEADDDQSVLLRQLHRYKAQRRNLQKQRRLIQKRIQIYESTEFEDLRRCIEARNDFSKHEIRRDFAQTIANLDRDDEQPDGSIPQTPVRDYSELERNLSVFCVSAKAYQGIRSRPEPDTRVGGFSQLEQTEIPALQRYCVALTIKSRERTAKRFLIALNSFLQSIAIWCSPTKSAAAISDQEKQEIEAGFSIALHDMTKTMNESRDDCISTIQRVKIISLLNEAWRQGNKAFSPTVASWNRPSTEGGFRYNTYQAICRRQGVFKQINMNDELAVPMLAKTSPGWRKAFARKLPEAYKTLREQLENALSRFHSETIRSTKWEVPQYTRQLLQNKLVTSHEMLRHKIDDLQEWSKTKQKEALDKFSENIATELHKTYEACAEHRGIGTLQAVRTTMSDHAERQGKQLFRSVSNQVEQTLQAILCELKVKIERLAEKRLQDARQDYHRALIAPHLKQCSQKKARFKAQILHLVRNAEADLQLGVLLGGGGLPQSGEAPGVDKQKAAATTTESAANS